jgi:hypothetical protein
MEVEEVGLDLPTEAHEQAKVQRALPFSRIRANGDSTETTVSSLGLYKPFSSPSKSLRKTASRIDRICDLGRVWAVLCNRKI